MLIIIVTDVENNKWKRNAHKKTKTEKKEGAKAIVKGWELNDFVVHLS